MSSELLARPGASLLLLRGFLGVTFVFAGLQKLANPAFFRSGAPGSFDQQLLGAMRTSPVHQLLAIPAHAPTFFAVVIALAEVAVGLGTLAGLLARLAALGGMVLSLSFFLTVSWTATPYYYGADIVFLFAWTPLLLGGAGAFALDSSLAPRPRLNRSSGSDRPRRLPWRARPGRGPESAPPAPTPSPALSRRAVLGAVAAAGAALVGLDTAVGRLLAPKGRSSVLANLRGAAGGRAAASQGRAPRATSGGSALPKGSRIGLASEVPVGGAASFTDPAQGIPAYLVQPAPGVFKAFSAVCTHAGCTVEFAQQQEEFVCPCHGSVFASATGKVLQGPAELPLPSIPVALGPSGEIYVDG